jgi:hypothetical protein
MQCIKNQKIELKSGKSIKTKKTFRNERFFIKIYAENLLKIRLVKDYIKSSAIANRVTLNGKTIEQ